MTLDLSQYIGDIARRLLGTPNADHSSSTQLRFGTNGSVAVEIDGPAAGSWFDHEMGEGGGVWELLTIKGSTTNGTAADWLKNEFGIDVGAESFTARIVQSYDYADERGLLLFQVVRLRDPKDFRQRRPIGGGNWDWHTKGVRKVVYRLPELLATPIEQTVFIVEGEKDVDRLRGLGLAATCNPGGAAKRGTDGKPGKPKWRAEYNSFFSGRDVAVIPDNDQAGRDHAIALATNLAPVAARVCIIELPDLPPKGDVSDWLDAGGTREELERLAAEALVFEPGDNQVTAIALPSQSEAVNDTEETIRAEISALMLGDIPGATGVIERIAAARFPPLVVDELLGLIRKQTGLKAKALDQTLSQARRAGSQNDGDDGSQATTLVWLAVQSGAEFFHNPAGDSFATIEIDGHRETWPTRSKALRSWLTKIFYDETAVAPNSESLGAALNVLEAMARFDGKEIPVWLRVGEHEGKIYLDLCDASWRAVEIDAAGWRIVSEPPVRFRRTAGMSPLPEPHRGGNIERLRALLNVPDQSSTDQSSFVLTVGFLLGALNPRGPYGVLGLGGEHGAAKTSFARTVRDMIDPHSLPPRSLPREDRDLFIAANNGWLLAFDNVSGLPDWLSDSLCRLSTGGGFATRALYTDGEEVLFEAMRPVILNGIEDFITRADLADRSLLLTLKRLEKPIPETELRARFKKEHPGILGALLDAASHGLSRLHETTLERLPRMADFTLWVTACEGSLWETGTFIKAYEANRAEATETVLDADPVAGAVRKFMLNKASWEGSATDLLASLAFIASDTERRERKWPKAGNALSGRLRRVAVGLRDVGIDVQFGVHGHGNTRTIVLKGSLAKAEGSLAKAEGSLAPKLEEPPLASDASDANDISPTEMVGGRARQTGEVAPKTARAPGVPEIAERSLASLASPEKVRWMLDFNNAGPQLPEWVQ